MNSITLEEYDAVVEQRKEWQPFPWGRLLYTISPANIQRHIDRRPRSCAYVRHLEAFTGQNSENQSH